MRIFRNVTDGWLRHPSRTRDIVTRSRRRKSSTLYRRWWSDTNDIRPSARMHSYIAARIVSLVACPGRKRLAIHGITCSRVVIATLHKHGLASCRGDTDAKHFTSSIVIRPRRWTSTLNARCVYDLFDGKMQGPRATSSRRGVLTLFRSNFSIACGYICIENITSWTKRAADYYWSWSFQLVIYKIIPPHHN